MKPSKHPTLPWRQANAAALLLTIGSALAQAQTPAATALNPRWHGAWQSDDAYRLVISAQTIKTQERSCRWVSNRPKAIGKACVAFYEDSIPKSLLVSMFNDAEREIRRQSNDKQSPLDPADRKRLLEDLKRHRALLAGVSNDGFRRVVLETELNEGDCANYYFLDTEFIYEVTTCPYPEANALRRFQRSSGAEGTAPAAAQSPQPR